MVIIGITLPVRSSNWHRVLVDGDAPEHKTGWEVLSLLISETHGLCSRRIIPGLGERGDIPGMSPWVRQEMTAEVASGGETEMGLQLRSQKELEGPGYGLLCRRLL